MRRPRILSLGSFHQRFAIVRVILVAEAIGQIPAVVDHRGDVQFAADIVDLHVDVFGELARQTRILRRHAGTSRADIVVGNRDGASADSRFTALIVDSFQALGYNVSLNYPYKGGYLTQCFANRQQQRHSVQIEINRQLYMDEATFRPHQGFAQLQQHLMQISATLADFVMAELAGKKGNQDV